MATDISKSKMIKQVVTPHELLARWPGCSEQQLAGMVIEGSLPGYWLGDKRRDNPRNKGEAYRCIPGALPSIYDSNQQAYSGPLAESEEYYIDWGDGPDVFCFDCQDARNVEGECQFLLCPPSNFSGDPHALSTEDPDTSAATRARTKQADERWSGHLQTAVKAAVGIVKNGKTQLKRDTVLKQCKMIDPGFSTRAFEALWKALPSDYKKGPGAPTQSE